LVGGRSPFPITCASGPSAEVLAPSPVLQTSVAAGVLLATGAVGAALVVGAGVA
jgi:hypothetical protein